MKLQWTAATDGVGAAGYEVVRAGHVVAGGPSLAAREMGLRPYTEYCYAVRAFDAAGNRSGPSPDACVRTLDTTPPSVPQHVVATATSDRAVQVLWQASTDNVGVTSYELRRADGVVAATSATAWAEERDLAPGRRYCYTVQAVDLAGNFSAPSAVACAVTPDLTPPTPPDAVAAQPVSSSSVFLVWQPSVDDVAVTGYELLSDGELTATVTGPEATAAVPNGKHCFRVRAFDAAGNRSALSDAICAVTADPSQPAAPFRLRAEPASEKAVQLSWQPSSVPGVVYRVYWEGGKSIGATRSTGFSAIGLKPGERHCYRVGAIDESGHESPRTLEACAAPRGEALTVRE